MTIGFWSFEDSPIVDCRSAIIPTDGRAQHAWIIENRRIFKMAMQQTDFFDFIYRLDEHVEEFDPEMHGAIRGPRAERIEQVQARGIVRKDISAIDVCRLYDALRIDAVRRWLHLSDKDARPELLHEWFETSVDALLKGIESRD